MPKRQFCLGSITKCDVIRTGGGFQGGAKETPQKQYVICLANYRYYALGLHGVSFLALGGVCKLPQAVLQGVEGISDASLASRDCTLSTGEHKELGAV